MTQRVTALLIEHGHMTMREIARELRVRPEIASGMLGKAKQCKQIRIVGYRRDEDGGRLYPRAVYAAGSGPDAPRLPQRGSTDHSRRQRDRKRLAVSSVWQLAVPVDKRRFGAVTV